MKNTLNQQTEMLKKNMETVSQKSKESIKNLVDANTESFNSAFEANNKTFSSISKALYDNELDPAIARNIRSAYAKGLKLSEDTIDSIIDAHTKNLGLSVDFTTKFVDAIRQQDLGTDEGVENLLNLVQENLDKTTKLSFDNMQKFASVYNDHLNLALNFNKQFADIFSAQIDAMFNLQKKNLAPFYSTGKVEKPAEAVKKPVLEKVKA
ncbi:MAG: hypothetical protein ACLQQ4_13475 [Bacteroidia bacterium]